MNEIRHQDYQHEYRDNLQEKMIREDILIPRIRESPFLRCLTINTSRDIIADLQRLQDNYISSLTLMIESNLKNMSERRLKRLPLEQRMQFISFPEDFVKTTDIRTARHFNIVLDADSSLNETHHSPNSECLIDQKFFQLKLRSKAEAISLKLFDTTISNFHIDPANKKTVSYQLKN